MAHYASLAMDLFQQASDDRLANRSRVYVALATRFGGNPAAAQDIFEEVHRVALANHDHWVAGWIMQVFGAEALEWGEVDRAADYFARAHAIRRETGQQQNIVSDLAWLGRLKVAEARVDQALDLTALAIEKLEAGRGAFYVWQTPDVYLSRAEALGAAGRAEEARAAIQRAYEELQAFLTQISDADNRQRVLDSAASRRVMTAWERGTTRPYHLKEAPG
jgi:tetratricopeptide (TPR) repeat protein